MRRSALVILIFIAAGAGAATFYSGRKENQKPALTLSSPTIAPARVPASKDKSVYVPEANQTKPIAFAERDFSDLQKHSIRAWRLRSESGGRISRLTGGSILIQGEGYRERARNFLQRYARSVLGVRADALVESGQGARMVRYHQMENGALVWNSKVTIFFDDHDAIVHVVAEIQRGAPPSSRANITRAQAENLARVALESYVVRSGGSPVSKANAADSWKVQSFLFGEGGDLRWMYRFVISLTPPLAGEYEILIDAELGQVFSARNLARI